MTKTVARPVLISAEFAACIEEPVEFLGHHRLKGLKERQEILAPGGL